MIKVNTLVFMLEEDQPLLMLEEEEWSATFPKLATDLKLMLEELSKNKSDIVKQNFLGISVI